MVGEKGTFKVGGRPEWFQLLEDEQDNFRAALSWSLESDEVEFGLRLATALQPFWARRGHYGEGCRWLEEVLAEHGPASAVARAKAQNAIGWLAQWQGDVERASNAAEEGLLLCERAGIEASVTNHPSLTAALYRLGLGEAGVRVLFTRTTPTRSEPRWYTLLLRR